MSQTKGTISQAWSTGWKTVEDVGTTVQSSISVVTTLVDVAEIKVNDVKSEALFTSEKAEFYRSIEKQEWELIKAAKQAELEAKLSKIKIKPTKKSSK